MQYTFIPSLHDMFGMEYNVLMTSIELEHGTAQALRAQARARNLPLDMFLKQIADASTPRSTASGLAVAELDRLIKTEAGNYPSLPTSFSRADIYDQQH